MATLFIMEFPSGDRKHREAELQEAMKTNQGIELIRRLYHKAIGIPDGTSPGPGILVGQEMIPAILDYEFGKASG